MRLGLFAVVIGLGFISYGYYEASQDPIARRASIVVDNWPANTPPLRIVLLADTQMAGPDMTPERLRHIVTLINEERADMVLLAGDFISEKSLATKLYTADEAIEPLGRLTTRLGIFAVLGNHDYWADEAGFVAAIKQYDIGLLRNEALAVGPINLVGIDDEFTGHDDLAASTASLEKLPAAPNVVLTHGPDVVPDIGFDTAIILAGHTHCGQIVLPVVGAISYVSRYGDRFACGKIKDEGRDVIVTAGIGTSVMPLRIGARPDYWVLELKGKG